MVLGCMPRSVYWQRRKADDVVFMLRNSMSKRFVNFSFYEIMREQSARHSFVHLWILFCEETILHGVQYSYQDGASL